MPEKEKKDEEGLEWRDYVALVIAMLTTNLLPIVLFIVLLLVLLLATVGWG